jgi:hypothetical protein
MQLIPGKSKADFPQLIAIGHVPSALSRLADEGRTECELNWRDRVSLVVIDDKLLKDCRGQAGIPDEGGADRHVGSV